MCNPLYAYRAARLRLLAYSKTVDRDDFILELGLLRKLLPKVRSELSL